MYSQRMRGRGIILVRWKMLISNKMGQADLRDKTIWVALLARKGIHNNSNNLTFQHSSKNSSLIHKCKLNPKVKAQWREIIVKS